MRRRCCPPQGSGALTMPARWALGGWPRHPVLGGVAGGPPLCRGGEGPRHQQQTTHNKQQHTTTNNNNQQQQQRELRGAAVAEPCSAVAACEKWVSPNKVAPARDVHAMPKGGVGGGAYTRRLLQLWVPGTPAGAEAIPKRRTASPPGARRKGSRALLPLAT